MQQPSLFTMLFVAWGIAYLTRRRPIGGWLLYFYFQLYLSLLFSLIFLPGIIANINPAGWDSSRRYAMFITSTVPVIATQWFEVFTATRMLIQRNARSVWTLRVALYSLVICTGIAIYIDIGYFDSNAVFDIMSCVFAVIWSEYFRKAARVKQVFVDHNFSHPDAVSKIPKSPAEKLYIAKRAGVVAVIFFFVMLVVIGMNRDQKAPDVGMINLALIDGGVAAVISLFFRIRKSKRDALQRMGTPS
jgi:hypothetical protein